MKPQQRIEKFDKKWQLIYGPLASTWEGQQVAASFERNGIACIVEPAGNGKKYLYRAAEGYVELKEEAKKESTGYLSKSDMLCTKPRKSDIRKLKEEIGDIQGMVKRALAMV